MYETVTVDQAISRGRRMVTYPLIIIIVVIIIPCFYLNVEHILSTPFFIIGIIAGLTSAWLYRSVMIAKWRIWAFGNVRNVHELKKKATEVQLIGKDGGFWEKTEIRSRDDNEKLASFEGKFEKEDVFADDYSVPEETMIYYSKSKGYFNLVFALGLTGLGIFVLLAVAVYLAGIILLGFGAYLAYKEFSYVTNKNPQIILNKKGVETAETQFYEWKNIDCEEVTREYSNKTTHYYFQYNCPEGGVKLEINDYDTNQRALENLLHVYRVRSNTKPAINK